MTTPPLRFDAGRAAAYDDRIRKMIPGYETLHRLAEVVLSEELADDASVLVVGAGTGQELLQLAAAHPAWRFQAVEPSEAMAALAQEKLARAGAADRVAWHLGTLEDLPDGPAFDAATMLLALHFVPRYDKGGQLSMIAERLNAGAPLVLADSFGDPTTTRFKRLETLLKAWATAMGADATSIAEAFNPARTDLHRVPEEQIKALLREAGFIDIQRIYQALYIGAWLARTPR